MAVYLVTLREELTVLIPDDNDFQLLLEACEGHTKNTHHYDLFVGTCWDADRLDLGRVGIEPEVEYLNTSEAKRLIGSGELPILLGKEKRVCTVRVNGAEWLDLLRDN